MANASADVARAKLRRLAEELGGQSEVARLLRVDRSRVSRRVREEEPNPRNRARLETLEFVLSRLQQTFTPKTARKWLTGTNANLGNRRPIDFLARNRIAEVIAAIEQAELDSYT